MNKELMEALDVLEKEKEISKETLFEAIENSLMTACKNHFGKADNVHVEINRETCDFLVYAEKEVVPTKDDVEDDCLQIALEDAQEISKKAQVGDMLHVEIKSNDGDPLPMTETGYRSHFFGPVDPVLTMDEIEAMVRDWLDTEAAKPAWQDYVLRSQQLSLF